jgi:hypothetical protein
MPNYNTGTLIENEGLALGIPRKGSGVVTVAFPGPSPFFVGECQCTRRTTTSVSSEYFQH